MVVDEFEGNRGNTSWGNTNLHNQPEHAHAVGGTAPFQYQEEHVEEIVVEFENINQTQHDFDPIERIGPEHIED